MSNPSAILSSVEAKRDRLETLCRQFSVSRLELFGSAADGTFDLEHSDLDFLVEFHRPAGTNAFHQYFDFRKELSKLFDREIDLVSARSMWNPYFIQSVNKSRKLIYAA
jgi:predicted nucleotidyltransferase